MRDTDIVIYEKDSVDITFTLDAENENITSFLATDKIIFALRMFNSGPAILLKEKTNVTGTTVTFALSKQDTFKLYPQRYVYDIMVLKGDTQQTTVIKSAYFYVTDKKANLKNNATITASALQQYNLLLAQAEAYVASAKNYSENVNIFTPSVDAQGNLSWSNTKGLINPATVNIKGPQGVQGIQGVQGEKGDKGDAGPAGPVGATGPRGLQGQTGPQGPAGPQGPRGERGLKGDKGDNGRDFTYDDFTPTQLANLVGPQGAVGPRGAQGAQGIQGPKGDKGDKGDPGEGKVKSVNGIEPDSNGNVTIAVGEGGSADLSNYYTKTQVDNQFLTVNGDIETLYSDIANRLPKNLGATESGKYLKVDTDGAIITDTVSGGGKEWHEVVLSATDYDATNKRFVIDVGEGNEIENIVLYGQISTDNPKTSSNRIGLGFGDIGNIYTGCVKVFDIPANNAVLAMDGWMRSFGCNNAQSWAYNTKPKTQTGVIYFGSQQAKITTPSVSLACNSMGNAYVHALYWNNNNPRYFKIVLNLDDVNFAFILIKYTLK